jgi:type II secretory pathway pseudopilin PulG
MFRKLPSRKGDDGFSLIEAVVALSVASFIFAALAAAMISSITSVVAGRQAQQASDVLQQSMEQLRATGFDSLAMRPSDLSTNDTLPLSGCSCYNPVQNSTTGATETLALDNGGAVYPHVTSTTVNSTRYTLRKYVTVPTDSTGASYKRITVFATWTARGRTHTRSLSSFVVLSRSGLPLPDYKFTLNTSGTLCASPGAALVYGFTLKNNGARDSFALSSTSSGSLIWTYYLDNGAASPGTFGADDTTVPSVAGVPTLGTIDTNRSANFWAVSNVPGGASTGTVGVTFRATSVSDPAYFQEMSTTSSIALVCTGTPSPTPTPTPTPTSTSVAPPQPTATCSTSLPGVSTGSSVTPTSYYLRNGSTNTDNTTAAATLPIGKLTSPTSTTLWNYATDLSSNTAGRYLATTGTSVATTADWRYQFAGATKLVGDGVVDLWAAPASGSSTDAMVFTVTVLQLNGAGTVLSTITSTTYGGGPWGCSGPKHFGVSVPFGGGSGTSFSANDFVEVRVTVAGAAALLDYDTTTFQSAMTLPVKSGG